MKKKISSKIALLGVFLMLLIGFSAFKFIHHEKGNKRAVYAWYQISGTILPGANVPNANATYLGLSSTPPAQSSNCGGSKYLCVAGFNTSKVDPTTNHLIDDFQTANDTQFRKNQ